MNMINAHRAFIIGTWHISSVQYIEYRSDLENKNKLFRK